jgi:hypothetical protein
MFGNTSTDSPDFYESARRQTIRPLARFVPIIRTFAPFVAASGATELRALHFLYNRGGAAVGWIVEPSCSGVPLSANAFPVGEAEFRSCWLICSVVVMHSCRHPARRSGRFLRQAPPGRACTRPMS